MILKTIQQFPAQLKVCGGDSEAQQFHIESESKTKILNWNKCHASNLDLCEDQPTFSWCHGLCVFCVSNDVTWAHLSHLNSPQAHSMTLTVDTLTENGANTMWRRNKLAKIQSDINTELHSPLRVPEFLVLMYWKKNK